MRKPILCLLLLVVAFSASALHPYDHGIGTSEPVECQICLHHTASKPVNVYNADATPTALFRPVAVVLDRHAVYTAATLPAAVARGPPAA